MARLRAAAAKLPADAVCTKLSTPRMLPSLAIAIPNLGLGLIIAWRDWLSGQGLPTLTCLAVAQEMARDRSSVVDTVAHRRRPDPGGLLCARPVTSDCRGPIWGRRPSA